jgi:hypothetical protein
MIGKKGIVIERCAPEGLVRIGNEIWKGKSQTDKALEKGQEIIVVSKEGLLLSIEPVPAHKQTAPPSKTFKENLRKITKSAFSNIFFVLTAIIIAIILIIMRYYIWTKPIIGPVFKAIDGK